MKTDRRKRIIIGLAMLALMCVAFAPAAADAADRDVEWGGYQNSAENNGVVDDIALPVDPNETSLRWGAQLVSGYTVSFTPPLIIDGDLFVASNKHVYRIDKATGEIKKQSEELKLNVGYAMNPITYDGEKDQLYIPILNGRVQCLDAESLQSKWISKEYRYNQTLSPIACRGGMVYTGIWETETDDGVFFCLNADTGEEIWSYTPSTDGAASGDFPHGFYWAGAYVNENYVIVGSDDGADNGFAESGTDAYPENAVVYSFDRRTGAVVDRIENIKGDVRCSVVYHEGFVYFVSKGGRLYKAPLGSDGKFGQASFVQLKDRYGADSMMTASPVVHGGRIYVGAAGSKGQFSADGGHFFAVIRDDGTLTDDSLIYTVPVSGYPQAAPLLSTATENSDGKVRLYFTFNAFPGGIYCLEDSPAATASDHESAHLLYRPEKAMQQYCISPLCCDRDGTFYFNNDSGYLMAVEENKAWLAGGREVTWEAPFETGQLSYTLRAPGGTETVQVTPRIPDGSEMTVNVNGQPCPTAGIPVDLTDGAADISVAVSKTVGDRTWNRTYVLHVSSASDNANLAGLAITDTNTKPRIVDTEDKKACNSGVGYDPEFSAGVMDYVSRTYGKNKTFLNLWVEASDSDASIRVVPVNNVGNSAPNKYLNEDGTIKTGSNGRYPVYWVKGRNSAEVDVEVTSPSGKEKKTYHVTFVRGENYLDIGEAPLTLTPSSATLYTKGRDRSVSVSVGFDGADVTGDCTFTSTDPGVAAVDSSGRITAVSRGEAEVWVNYEAKNRRGRVHVDVKPPTLDPPEANIRPGSYTQPLQIELSSSCADVEIRYVTGGAEDNPDPPTTTTGEVYRGPISLGTPGETVTLKIKAIACGSGYAKSYPEEFVYTVDLRNDVPPAANAVSLDPGSIFLTEETLAGFGALPNGIGVDALKEMVDRVETARVILTPGSAGANIDSSDPDRPVTDIPVVWEDSDRFAYDPADAHEQSFFVQGRLRLPEGIADGGSTLRVCLPVTVKAGTVAPPEFDPAPGTYRSDRQVSLSSQTPGAAIYYTVSGQSGTKVYGEPIPLTVALGKKASWNIKAYAAKDGIRSETVSVNYTVDRTAEKPTVKPTAPAPKPALPAAVSRPEVSVNASAKKISASWPTAKGAASYLVSWRKAGGKWTSRKVSGRSFTITGLVKGGCYEVKVAGVNAAGTGASSPSRFCLMEKTTLKLTAGKKSFKAKVKKVKKAGGYQIRYSLKKSMAAAKTKNTKKTTLKINRLKGKKVYYVEAAPFKKAAGKMYVGQTVKKKVKTKK